MSVFLGLYSWEDLSLWRGPSGFCLGGKGLAAAGSRAGDRGQRPQHSEGPGTWLPVFRTMPHPQARDSWLTISTHNSSFPLGLGVGDRLAVTFWKGI